MPAHTAMDSENQSTATADAPEIHPLLQHQKIPPIVIGALVALLVSISILAAALTWAVPYVPVGQAAAASAAIPTDAFKDISLVAKGAYVIDAQTKQVLFTKNADIQLPLASITKVALVLAAAEVLDESEIITVSRGAIERGEGGGLGAGDLWRVRDLIDFTLTASSNSGAEVLAEAADARLHARYPQSSPEHTTVWRMNDMAKGLGLAQTFFLNPNGLDASLTQAGAFSSPHDVATLFLEASKAKRIFESTTQYEILVGPQNGEPGVVRNTNEVLGQISGLLLGKTGFTDLAGGNLAVCFEIEPGHKIVAVVMGSTDAGRFEDMLKLVAATKQTINSQVGQEGVE